MYGGFVWDVHDFFHNNTVYPMLSYIGNVTYRRQIRSLAPSLQQAKHIVIAKIDRAYQGMRVPLEDQ